MKEDEDKHNVNNSIIWLILFSSILLLFFGMIGYSYFENLSWSSSFYEAAAAMSTVGASSGPSSYSGKIFGGLYSLLSIIYIIILGIIIANNK